MPSDAEITLAFVAKRQGKDAMPASDWAHVLSLELGWLTPGVAKAFVVDCQASGLLRDGDGVLALGFDRKAVDIPKRYRPPDDLAAAAPSAPSTPAPSGTDDGGPADLFPALLARVASERDLEKSDILAEVEAVQARFGGRLTADAALVHVALSHGVDVAAEAAAALDAVKQAATR